MPTTLFPALLPNTDRADDYTPLKKGDGDDDAGDPGSEEVEISGTYHSGNKSDSTENTE